MLKEFCKINYYLWLMLPLYFLGACTEGKDPEPLLDSKTYIFWTSLEDRTIERAVIKEGMAVETEVLYDEVKGLQSPSGIVADGSTQFIYWTDFSARQILRAPWDGSGNPEVLYTASYKGKGPLELVLDQKNRTIYWSQPYDHLILRAPADGGGPVDTLFSKKEQINGVWGVQLALSSGHLYWVEYNDAEVWRVSLRDQAKPELLYAGGSGFLRPYALAVNEELNALYILDNPLPGSIHTDRILKGSLDGKQALEMLYNREDGVENAYALAVGPGKEYLYWHNQLNEGSIYRGTLAGRSEPECLLRGIQVGLGLAVITITTPLL
ncbi:hypothetical protein AAG747_21535 [Rapidithrix thailandica]|uniref:Uncharacterized protein n=1 Tax=Rapidithrix thailandica TaxID=413964 RepID=A0AAW9S327_9BACT